MPEETDPLPSSAWRDLLAHTEHRPYPLPGAPFVMTMSWHDLLFAHWPVRAEELRALVPAALELDLWEGEGWIGVVPFHMTQVGVPALNRLPWLCAFPELNVRTYVRRGGKPGVYFFSLDAACWPAVLGARATFHLPYFWARIALTPEGTGVRYESTRRIGPGASLRARYAPAGERRAVPAGSLEDWLTARYCLYATDGAGRVHRGEIHHLPWPLQPAEAELDPAPMVRWAGLRLRDTAPLLHFARRLDVVAWAPVRA
jgi:uncharacterized protein YqjF (DUF2071 family)